ncbi:MAG: pyridoxamine 5'-phosphate oxidase family protein [Actinomycetota bacterium]|nr:pyridoxamine 5'-phosphate oxidase family protein [Actinomycetota bacterium]
MSDVGFSAERTINTVDDMPDASRPGPPGWFEEKQLPWSWAERQLVRARNYWIATAGADGIAHTRPVWGVWLDGALVLSVGGPRMTADLEQRGGNVTVHLESADRVVILEGPATSFSATAAFVEVYNAKYDWDFTLETLGLFEFRPQVGYGWISDPDDRGETFQNSGTRWSAF